jgi:hypothetical protein
VYRIGCGAGFSGDRVDAAQPVVAEIANAGHGGALIFETMGERTLALGQIARLRNPEAGFDPYLPQFLPPILKPCIEAGIVIVGNFGCANPHAAARFIAAEAARQDLGEIRIAVVEGDDLLGKVDLAETERWDGDGALEPLGGEPVAINVYLGARPIAEAITAGAQVVITGRVADPALVVGPLVAHFGWEWNDLDRIAAATLAGHLLECGSQVSGGYFADPGFKDVPDVARVGFPIAEVEADGSFIITKPAGTGGLVDLRTVKEQMLYEIHDPSSYLTPDVTLDLSAVAVAQVGDNRVHVTGARGRPAPQKLKATVSYAGDWIGEAEISYAGSNALKRAELAVEIIAERVSFRKLPVKMRADIVGVCSVFDDDTGALRRTMRAPQDGDYRVRFAFSSTREDAIHGANQEVNALYCCGPAGGGGVRLAARPRIRTQSHLVERARVHPSFVFHGGVA